MQHCKREYCNAGTRQWSQRGIYIRKASKAKNSEQISFSCIIQLVIGIQSGHDCRASAARDSTDLADQRFYLLRGHSTILLREYRKRNVPGGAGGQRGQCSTCHQSGHKAARHNNFAFFCNFHSMFLFPLDFSL